jgi:sulfatase modifying factor 1
MRRVLQVGSVMLLLLATQAATAADMIDIPAGTFSMGCSKGDRLCGANEKPALKVAVPAFLIDAKEVTVAQYRACVGAGKCRPPKTHKLNQYCNYDAPQRDAHPVNCIDWDAAQAYCTTQGKRLPREAEWEKAARAGGTTPYSWGRTASCREAIANDRKTTGSVKGEMDGCGEDRTWPVASRAANVWGLYDMHGNAGEWVVNGYAEDALSHYAKGELDYPLQSTERVVRGGSWDEKIDKLRASYRNSKPPVSGEVIYGSVGFRCARDAQLSR